VQRGNCFKFNKLRRMSVKFQKGTRNYSKELRAETLRNSCKLKLRRNSAIVHKASAKGAKG